MTNQLVRIASGSVRKVRSYLADWPQNTIVDLQNQATCRVELHPLSSEFGTRQAVFGDAILTVDCQATD